MEKLIYQQKKIIKRVCTMKYASSIYFLILNRISNRISQDELSFLIGKDDEFIFEVERLERSSNDLELIASLYKIFRNNELILNQADDTNKYLFELTTWSELCGTYYRMEYYINDTESILFFQLIDDTNYEENSEDNICEQFVVELAIQKLMEVDYFKKLRTPLQIHNQIEVWSGSKIKAMSLKLVLETLWGRKGTAPLKRTKQKSYGYRFQKHK